MMRLPFARWENGQLIRRGYPTIDCIRKLTAKAEILTNATAVINVVLKAIASSSLIVLISGFVDQTIHDDQKSFKW